MGKLFENEVNSLKRSLREMSDLATAMISSAIDALVARDREKISRIEASEDTVNRLEMEIDDLAWKMIALRQPMGMDLRFIIASIKVNSVLERIGDEAVNISQKAQFLLGVPQLKPLIDIPRMTESVIWALTSSVQTLYDGDTDLAREVCINDSEIDDLRNQIYRELITYMQDSPDNIQRALNLMFIAKSLERIGDMATDIAEDAIYLHQGKDIRHHAESDEEFRKNYRGRRGARK